MPVSVADPKRKDSNLVPDPDKNFTKCLPSLYRTQFFFVPNFSPNYFILRHIVPVPVYLSVPSFLMFSHPIGSGSEDNSLIRIWIQQNAADPRIRIPDMDPPHACVCFRKIYHYFFGSLLLFPVNIYIYCTGTVGSYFFHKNNLTNYNYSTRSIFESLHFDHGLVDSITHILLVSGRQS